VISLAALARFYWGSPVMLHRFCRTLVRSPWCLLGLSAVVALAALPVAAQEEPDADATAYNDLVKAQRALTTDWRNAIESGQIENKKSIDDYLDVTFQLWVHPLHEREIQKTRSQRLKPDLNKAGNAPAPEVHAYLLDEVLRRVAPLVADEQQTPAVRLNSILLIGDLNSKELPPGGTGDAIPLEAALPILIDAFTATDHDAVRVGAQIGLLRHAASPGGIKDKAQAASISSAMIQLLSANQPPDGRSAEAHAWMRRRAAETLGALGAPGSEAQPRQVIDALANVVNDATAPIALRTDAAEALGRLKLEGVPDVDYTGLAASLGNLAVFVTEEELTRRELRNFMNQIETPLNGPHVQARSAAEAAAAAPGGFRKLAAGTDHAAFVEGMWTPFNALVSLLLDPDQEDDAVTDEIVDLGETLATWLEENAPAGEPVAAN
jgi:hypothetical protein